MKKQARRDFIRKSIAGMAGISVLPAGISSGQSMADTAREFARPVSRVLGNTGLTIPVISVGAGSSQHPGFIRAAYDAGLKFFFTATYYGEGNNEKMLGDAVKEFGRDTFLVGTAVLPRGVDHKAGIYTSESTYDDMVKRAEDSLRRFGMEYVDLMLLPYAARRESVFFEPLLRAMEDLKKKGMARFIGIATHSSVAEAIRAAADTGVYDAAMVAYNFKNAHDVELQSAMDYVGAKGLGLIAMKTQAGAYWDKERTQPINSRATIKWALQNKNITTVVSGMSTIDQLQQNIALMQDLELTEQERIDLKLSGDQDVTGLYCRQCKQCLSQCPNRLDIPTIMRSYMYAYGYKDLALAHATLGMALPAGGSCEGCGTCRVNCSMGFRISERVNDIARLRTVPPEFLQA